MPDPNRSPNSGNQKRKEKEETEKEMEKRAETESEMHLDPLPHGAPLDVDREESIYAVSDEDSIFGSEYDMAAEDAGDLIQFGEEPAITTGTNVPYLPSFTATAPVAPPTQARETIRGDNPHPLVLPSSTVTIPPRGSTGHSVASASSSLTQKRSSTGTDTSHPLSPPSFTDLPWTNGHGPTSKSPQVSSATRGTSTSNSPPVSSPLWQPGLTSHELTAPRPGYTTRAPPLCVVCNERPAYNDGRRAFPTCGNTCARALEATKKWTPSARSNSTQVSSAARGSPTSNFPRVSSPLWQPGLTSHEPGLRPGYTPRAPPLCVVCNERPAYNDGRRAFPTCGNTCARALEATKKSSPSVRKSSHSYSTAVSNGPHPFTAANLYQTRQTTIRMCDVCHVRPKYQTNGKILPFCGLTCAAKLHPPGSVEMCDYCGERPKVVFNGHKFPHCGTTTCGDKAKVSVDLASANAATRKTCLICWQAECDDQRQSNYCSNECEEVANKRAPFLLEVPRGHAAFKKVSDFYTSQGKNTRTPCPAMKKLSMVVMRLDFTTKYEEYRMKLSPSIDPRSTSRRKGNEKRLWLRLNRECHFGNEGNMEPCSSKKCILCSLIRSSVSKEIVQHGILRPSSLARAVEMSSQIRKKTSEVVLLANVLLGREIEMTKDEIDFADELPPHGYESVHLIRYGMFGGKTDGEESFVFNADAVKPLYLITHE